MYSIRKYQYSDGRIPFDDWIKTFKNPKDRARLLKRLDKVQLGNLGDWGSIGDGVFELREHFGTTPGMEEVERRRSQSRKDIAFIMAWRNIQLYCFYVEAINLLKQTI